MITELITRLLSAQDLPETPPADPMPTLVEWLADAQKSGKYDDPNAMALATATRDGAPSARMVLCKSIELSPPALTFFTNFLSRKGDELRDNPRAAAIFHWPHAKRQARVEGTVVRMSDHEADEYFRTRALLSRIGATVSPQSRPIASRQELVKAALSVAATLASGGELPRPAHWGGFRILATSVELWSAREGRLHQRLLWKREPTGAWSVCMLAP